MSVPRTLRPWAAPAVWQGGSCPLVSYTLPRLPPVVLKKNYMCPLDPSRPLSQRKVYVKIYEMCQNKTLHGEC